MARLSRLCPPRIHCCTRRVTYTQLVLRTQDVKESVRRAAFRTLGEDVRVKVCRRSAIKEVSQRDREELVECLKAWQRSW